jgi:cell division protein FtsL
MNKITLILVVALLGSCLALVRSAYESRRVFAELDRAKQEQRRLDAEFKRLDAERQDQATHRRVERVAREKLAMGNPVQGATVFVADVPNAAQPGARP